MGPHFFIVSSVKNFPSFAKVIGSYPPEMIDVEVYCKHCDYRNRFVLLKEYEPAVRESYINRTRLAPLTGERMPAILTAEGQQDIFLISWRWSKGKRKFLIATLWVGRCDWTWKDIYAVDGIAPLRAIEELAAAVAKKGVPSGH